jgi:hypothetical protein
MLYRFSFSSFNNSVLHLLTDPLLCLRSVFSFTFFLSCSFPSHLSFSILGLLPFALPLCALYSSSNKCACLKGVLERNAIQQLCSSSAHWSTSVSQVCFPLPCLRVLSLQYFKQFCLSKRCAWKKCHSTTLFFICSLIHFCVSGLLPFALPPCALSTVVQTILLV